MGHRLGSVILLVTALAALTVVCGPAEAARDEVHVLVGSNFHYWVNKEPLSLVLFYVPGCRGCAQIMPLYADAAELLADRGSPIKLAKMDVSGTKERKVAIPYGFQRMPAFRVFQNGTPRLFRGHLEAEMLAAYLERFMMPDFEEVTTVDDVEKWRVYSKDQNMTLVMGYFPADGSADAQRDEFDELAAKEKDIYVFVRTSNSEILQHYEFESDATKPGLFVFSMFEDPLVELTLGEEEEFTNATMLEFVRDVSLPLLGNLTHETYGMYAERRKPLVQCFLPLEEDEEEEVDVTEYNYFHEHLLPIARKFHRQAFFMFVVSDQNEMLMDAKGISGPFGIAAEFPQNNTRYGYHGSLKPFDAEAVEKFVEDVIQGNLEPFIKSEPIPESNDGRIKKAVRNNFDKLVMSFGTHALVLFTREDDCEACEDFASTYVEFADRVEYLKNLTIVSFDTAKNEFHLQEKFQIPHLPFVYWKGAGSNPKLLPYQGDMTADALEKFVRHQLGVQKLTDISKTSDKFKPKPPKPDETADGAATPKEEL